MAEKSMVERSLYPSVVLVKLKKDLSSQSLALKTLESPFSLPMGSGGMFTVTNSIIIPFVLSGPRMFQQKLNSRRSKKSLFELNNNNNKLLFYAKYAQ